MAQKRLNPESPGQKRPLRVADVQDVWTGLVEALSGFQLPGLLTPTDTSSGNPVVICGLLPYIKNDGGTLVAGITRGVIAYNGVLYGAADGDLMPAQPIYVKEVRSDDLRIFEDGTERVFSFLEVLTNDPTDATPLLDRTGVQIVGTPASIDPLRIGVNVPDNFITNEKIISLDGDKLNARGVSPAKIARELSPASQNAYLEDILSAPSSGSNFTYPIPEGLSYDASSGRWTSKRIILRNVTDGNYLFTFTTPPRGFAPFRDYPAIFSLVLDNTTNSAFEVHAQSFLDDNTQMTTDALVNLLPGYAAVITFTRAFVSADAVNFNCVGITLYRKN